MIQSWGEYANTWEVRKREKKISIDDKRKTHDDLEVLGDEWGISDSVNQVVSEFIVPYITQDSRVLEVGCGGGRIGRKIVSQCKHLYFADVSKDMLKIAQQTCENFSNVTYTLIDGRHLQAYYPDVRFDFIYIFDVLVHLSIEDVFRYLQEMRYILRDSGKIFIHTMNIETDGGYAQFQRQIEENSDNLFGSLKFISATMLEQFASRLNYRIVKQNNISEQNFYYKRDALFILEKN